MRSKMQRRQNVGWFSPARRKFLASTLKYTVLLTTVARNIQSIVRGCAATVAPTLPVRITAHDTVAVTVGTGTLRFGA